MYAKILFTLSISVIDCFYLEAESNFLKPNMERNNIVNKGVWVRNQLQDLLEKSNLGNFIFRPNSGDADNFMQNTFDKFGANEMQETPFLSKYVQRIRRSPDHIRKRRPRKSMKPKKGIKNSVEDSVMIKSKLVSDLKPSSVFNEYPYQVAILLNNDPKKVKNMTVNKELDKRHHNISKDDGKNISNTVIEELKVVTLTNSTDDVTKRSKKYDHTEDVNNYNLVEQFNNTENTDTNKQSRDMFRKDDRFWNPYILLPEKNTYKIVPRLEEKPKTVTEKGLIKVISMLTKTFKKIIKQHGEIKKIHDKLANMNQEFNRKVADLVTKFDDFDSKYSDMVQFNFKLQSLQTALTTRSKYFETKQKEIETTFSEFQNQQKKFLAQQRQFYTIQKLMLAQNEKINAKQNVISKTQSEISHRQNNFARILKKTKQIIENQTKVNYTLVIPNDRHSAKFNNTTTPVPKVTTPMQPNTQAMKINLFAIPTKNKLMNQDALIIKEKDQKQIDDLVYKYYFNNTFIDFLMKSKILNNYDTNNNINSVELGRRNSAKNKRDELETTLLLPVKNSLSESPAKRERRWINHFSKNKYRRLHRHRKETTAILNPKNKTNDTKIDPRIDEANEIKIADNKITKNDPFLTMAMNFCNEIGQNVNEQVLKWCIEKAMRRLKFMQMNAFTPPPPPVTVIKEITPQVLFMKLTDLTTQTNKIVQAPTVGAAPMPSSPSAVLTTVSAAPTTLNPPFTTMYALPTQETQTVFFPDNDQLESNLKQYDLKPDTEGNVYYEGSLHISDFGRKIKTADSEGTSDVMPGLMESNSQFQMDPMAFDLQAKRRAYVRQLNENILKHMRG